MNIRNRYKKILVSIFAVSVIITSVYITFYRTYVLVPKEDIKFLTQMPAKSEAIKRFIHVDEELDPGDRFVMTGWHPLPQRMVTGSAFSVVRKNGTKIYLFFNTEGKLEEYYITKS